MATKLLMPDIHEQYEGHLQRHIARTNRRIQQAYISAIQEVSNQVDKIRWNGQVFSINEFPAVKQKIDSVIAKMQPKVYGALVNSIKTSWDLSNQKNNIIVDRRIAQRRPNKRVKQILYDPNKEAMDQFIARKEKGLGLSQRVWNTLSTFKTELEGGLGDAITNGYSAKETAKKLRKNLVEPDRLFRRVRENGKLRLSNAAKAYHPGQGVYRSSVKNAERLTRTENNMAYRTSDYERWQNMPFVIGIEVKLSNAHRKYDICDRCKGVYPKDFKFRGWHPQCICYQVPKMVSDEEYDKIEDAILAGEEPDLSGINQVTSTPAGFDTWVNENKKRVDGWKNTPYWVKDNPQYYEGKKAVEKQPPPAPTKEIKFRPAKSEKEAEKRIRSFLTGKTDPRYVGSKIKYGYDLNGASLDKLNDILNGLENTIGKYDIKLDGVGWHNHASLKNAKGAYLDNSSGNKSITFDKRRSLKAEEVAKRNRKIFEENKKGDRDLILKSMTGVNAEDALKRLDQVECWSISDVSQRPLFATAAHEGYHAVYFKYNLEGEFSKNLRAGKVLSGHWTRVSEYGGSDIDELFAEIGAAVETGRSIPENIKNAFLKTLQAIKL